MFKIHKGTFDVFLQLILVTNDWIPTFIINKKYAAFNCFRNRISILH